MSFGNVFCITSFSLTEFGFAIRWLVSGLVLQPGPLVGASWWLASSHSW